MVLVRPSALGLSEISRGLQIGRCSCDDYSVGLFRRNDVVKVKKVAVHARYVDADVQRVNLKLTTAAGDESVIELSLDQTRQLVIDLTTAYSACRPSVLDQKQVDRITTYFGMR